jgi:hypothetical protein
MRGSVGFALRNLLSRVKTQEQMRFQMLIAHEVFEKMSIGTMAS